jgi:PTH1 family peptidyl-tRNA hydrolase
MKLVVGIGNPGEEYAGTRHNVGFDVVERVATRCRVQLERDRRLEARIGRCDLGGADVLLVEPLSYVNLSGPVVAKVARERATPPADVLVVVDDYHLPLGALRMRLQGSAGGHNGLKSIIQALGTDAFPRLRIGIGEAPPERAAEFVLQRFRPSERPVMDEALERGADCAETWARRGSAAAMDAYNG